MDLAGAVAVYSYRSRQVERSARPLHNRVICCVSGVGRPVPGAYCLQEPPLGAMLLHHVGFPVHDIDVAVGADVYGMGSREPFLPNLC